MKDAEKFTKENLYVYKDNLTFVESDGEYDVHNESQKQSLVSYKIAVCGDILCFADRRELTGISYASLYDDTVYQIKTGSGEVLYENKSR